MFAISSNIPDILKRLGVLPRKSRGQNFLVDSKALSDIVEFYSCKGDDQVLEIGPGLGVLTEQLIPKAKKLIAVEKEPGFCKYLAKEFASCPSFQVIEGDIRDFKPEVLFPEVKSIRVIGNIPYSLSSEIVIWTLDNRRYIQRASFLMQKEFAERVAAEPGSRAYGSLSVLCSLYAFTELGPEIAGDCFYPSAKVNSRLIHIMPRAKPLVEVEDPDYFEKFVRGCFARRRKTILNNLRSVYIDKSKLELESGLEKCGIDPLRRAETLSVQKFAELCRLFGPETA